MQLLVSAACFSVKLTPLYGAAVVFPFWRKASRITTQTTLTTGNWSHLEISRKKRGEATRSTWTGFIIQFVHQLSLLVFAGSRP
jgi:hypothetical protein